MKKFLIFIGGFVVGVLATIFIAYVISVANEPNDGLLGLTKFPEKGECITTVRDIEVFQVLESNVALARAGSRDKFNFLDDEIVVLLINYDGQSYYDDQKIKIPKDKCARQIGTYRYTTRQDKFEKTVPAIIID